MKPTREQEKLFNYVKKRNENILIKAYAGCGKTTSIVEAVKLLPTDKSVLFLAFNKHIQEELKLKVPPHVKCFTTYGLGNSAILRKYGKDIKFDEFKLDKIIKEKSKTWDLEEEFDFDLGSVNTYLTNIKKLVNLCRLTLTIKPDYIPYVAEKFDINIRKSKDIKRVLKILDAATNDRTMYDFTDMIYLPAIDNSLWMYQYQYVFVDEIQDLNRCQIKIIEKSLKRDRKTGNVLGRLISVGDGHQCQPAGTKILMADGEEVNIEDVVVDNKVVTYDRHNKGVFVGYYKNHRWGGKSMYSHGYNVNDISKRLYSDDLICIGVNDKLSKYTFNHKCMVRINEKSKYKFVLYLMEKDGYFRMGITPLWSKNKIDFTANRAKQENCDKFWILKTYENKTDAFLDEQFYSTEFSIPQMIFNHRQQKGNINQNIIDCFYKRFNKENMFINAEKTLTFFKRKYEFPFWTKHTGCYFSKKHMFEIRACNIISEIMEMVIFNDKNVKVISSGAHTILPEYVPIQKFYYEYYNDYVYSLNIDKHNLYVADGILTHNCIYGFNGTDEKSFEWFENYPNTEALTLSTSFRCSKSVIAKAQEIVPEIQALETAPEGIVRQNGNVLEEATNGDFVLCRTTMPLVELFFQFLAKDKKAIIKGSDIGVHLIELIGNIDTVENVVKHWNKELSTFRNELFNSGIINPNEHSGYTNLEDKVNTLLFLAKYANSIADLKLKIKTIFTDEIEGICLSTVHKVKGLEANRVFIIRPDLLPMTNVRKPWEIQQEKNLTYVAYTRAKLELIFDNNWTNEK